MTDDLVEQLRKIGEGDMYIAPTSTKAIIDIAADRIEHLKRELMEERHSREVAAAKGWGFSNRIKRLERALRHCVDAIREYELGDSRPERTPRPDIRPWLLGAMDHARIVLEEKPNDLQPNALGERVDD